jgi:hypothetical protein
MCQEGCTLAPSITTLYRVYMVTASTLQRPSHNLNQTLYREQCCNSFIPLLTKHYQPVYPTLVCIPNLQLKPASCNLCCVQSSIGFNTVWQGNFPAPLQKVYVLRPKGFMQVFADTNLKFLHEAVRCKVC